LKNGKNRYRIKAGAKANLYLEITGKREDGFHNLYSLFIPIQWYDTLDFSLLKEGKTRFSSSDPCISENNTVSKAIEKLYPYRKNQTELQIHLIKNVPYMAGLGSASSDAASTLSFLNDFWECGLPREKLEEIGLEIGSDTPFFFYEKPCVIRGRGEIIEPIHNHGKFFFLIVKPKNIHISTQEAYQLISEKKAYTNQESLQKKMLASFINGNSIDFADSLFNGFESFLIEKYFFFKDLKKYFKQSGALNSVLSGSGSSFTGVYKDLEDLEKGLFFFKQKNIKNIFDFKISFL